MFNQCNIFLFTRKKRTPATITVAVLNFYTIGSSSETQKVIWMKMNLQIRNQVPVNLGCGWARVQMKRRPTIITVHLPEPAASPSASNQDPVWKLFSLASKQTIETVQQNKTEKNLREWNIFNWNPNNHMVFELNWRIELTLWFTKIVVIWNELECSTLWLWECSNPIVIILSLLSIL